MNTAHSKSIKDVRAFLKEELIRSTAYPPETSFQHGYHAALEEVARLIDPEGYDPNRRWWLPELESSRDRMG